MRFFWKKTLIKDVHCQNLKALFREKNSLIMDCLIMESDCTLKLSLIKGGHIVLKISLRISLDLAVIENHLYFSMFAAYLLPASCNVSA